MQKEAEMGERERGERHVKEERYMGAREGERR